jgi:YD repeat-containing protein
MAANNYGNRIKTSEVGYYDSDLGKFIKATINYTLTKNADGTNSHKFDIQKTYDENGKTVTINTTFVGNDVDLQTRKAELMLGRNDLTQVAMPNLSINPQTANEVWQPLKHSDIHYMPTSGAVKQGIGNVNSNTAFFSKMKRSIPDPAQPNQSIGEYSNLNFMKVKMLQAGIQLDKEHHADNSVLSLMTQVISAACAKGFKIQESSNLYNALYELSKIGTEDFRDELGKLNIVLEDPEQAEKFRLAAAKIVLKTMINSTSQDGDMVQSIARELIKEMSKSKDFTITDEIIKGTDTKPGIKVPWSSPEIFRKVISALSSSLTKQSIKSKIPGILSVLCPAHNIVKFYKYTDEKGNTLRVRYDALERLLNVEDSGNDDVEETIDQKLEELQAKEPAIQNTSEIEMGFKYLATHADGS